MRDREDVAMLSMMLLQIAAMDLSKGPVASTNVAVEVKLDAEGKVTACRVPKGDQLACKSFVKGRTVASPLRRHGKPVAGKMTVSTTTVVSPL
jgi:hypothetical protein